MKISDHFENVNSFDFSKVLTVLRRKAPDWLSSAVLDAHQSDGPHEWIHTICHQACIAYDGCELRTEDDVFYFTERHVDTYTKDLFLWAADMCLSDTFANAEQFVRDELGFPENSGAEAVLRTIQFQAIEAITRTMLTAILENASASESEPTAVDVSAN